MQRICFHLAFVYHTKKKEVSLTSHFLKRLEVIRNMKYILEVFTMNTNYSLVNYDLRKYVLCNFHVNRNGRLNRSTVAIVISLLCLIRRRCKPCTYPRQLTHRMKTRRDFHGHCMRACVLVCVCVETIVKTNWFASKWSRLVYYTMSLMLALAYIFFCFLIRRLSCCFFGGEFPYVIFCVHCMWHAFYYELIVMACMRVHFRSYNSIVIIVLFCSGRKLSSSTTTI